MEGIARPLPERRLREGDGSHPCQGNGSRTLARDGSGRHHLARGKEVSRCLVFPAGRSPRERPRPLSTRLPQSRGSQTCRQHSGSRDPRLRGRLHQERLQHQRRPRHRFQSRCSRRRPAGAQPRLPCLDGFSDGASSRPRGRELRQRRHADGLRLAQPSQHPVHQRPDRLPPHRHHRRRLGFGRHPRAGRRLELPAQGCRRGGDHLQHGQLAAPAHSPKRTHP